MIKVAMSGLPGRMALAVAEKAVEASDIELYPFGLTGPDTEGEFVVKDQKIELLPPSQQVEFLKEISSDEVILIDYSHPTAVEPNVKFYTDNSIPFVLGTTGGDYSHVENMIIETETPAVVAPNMALPIVMITAMLEWAKENFPGVFDQYNLEVRESHQKGKADTSGTAKALIELIKGLGADFQNDNLKMCRDPQEQKNQLGIPDEFITGHAYHTYDIRNQENTAHFQLGHNILGRGIYAEGTLDGVRFLNSKLSEPVKRSYNMIDVLENLKK